MILNIFISMMLLYLFSVLFIVIDDTYNSILDFIKDKFFKKELPKKSYRDTEEMMMRMRNKKPVKELYYSIYRFFDFIKKSPFVLYKEIKWFIQRGLRGYSDRDLWCVDSHLSNIISRMLKDLKPKQHILPGWEDGETQEVAQKRWHGYLDNMIYTFETARKIIDYRYYYQYSKNYSVKRANEYDKIDSNKLYKPKARSLTKEECKKYERGWELFQEHFFSLWD